MGADVTGSMVASEAARGGSNPPLPAFLAAVAQLVERSPRKRKVRGSNPRGGSWSWSWARSSSGRAPLLQSGGGRFESCRVHAATPKMTSPSLVQGASLSRKRSRVRIPSSSRTEGWPRGRRRCFAKADRQARRGFESRSFRHVVVAKPGEGTSLISRRSLVRFQPTTLMPS
jgi:hypothetical protein